MYNFLSIIRILLLIISIILSKLPFVKTQEINYQNDGHETIDITAFVFGHINLLACSFVIYSAFKKWRSSSLSISSRVPLYLSISDVCQYPIFMPNFYYSLIQHKAIPDITCKVLAYLLFLQININMILMASIALVTYLRVVKCRAMNLGKYDWKIFAWVVISSSFFSIPSIPSLGPSKFWCLTTPNPTNTLLIGAYSVFTVTFIVTCYCYYMTLSTIFGVDREELSDSTGRIDRRNKLERQATRKILIYILIFMKWVPLLLYGVCIMLSYNEPLWIDISAIIAFNLGGLCNCVLYFMNESKCNNAITYTLEIEEDRRDENVNNNSSSCQFQSFRQHHQRINSVTNSITLVMPILSNDGSVDLKTCSDDTGDNKGDDSSKVEIN